MSNNKTVQKKAVPITLGYTQSKIISFEYTWEFTFTYSRTTVYRSPLFSPGCDGKLKFYLTSTRGESSLTVTLCMLPCNMPTITLKIEGYIGSKNGKAVLKLPLTTKPLSIETTEFTIDCFDGLFVKNLETTANSLVSLQIELVINNYTIPASTTVIKVPQARLLEDMGNLFESQKFSDVKINVGGLDLPAHKTILSMRSTVFAAMFEHEMSENQLNRVTVIDMEPEVAKELLRYIYTDEVQNLDKIADKLLIAADKYDLNRLKLMCEEMLRTNLTIDNAINTLILADFHHAQELKAQVIDFITLNSMAVTATADFESMISSHRSLLMEVVRAISMRQSCWSDERMLNIV